MVDGGTTKVYTHYCTVSTQAKHIRSVLRKGSSVERLSSCQFARGNMCHTAADLIASDSLLLLCCH